MIALKREPLGRRASTIGEVSSTRRPTRETIRSMIWSRCSLSRKTTSDRWIRPSFSTKIFFGPLIMMSAILSSLSRSSSGPKPKVSSRTSLDQPLALVAVQQRVLGVAEMLDDAADLAAERVRVHLADPVHVEPVDQLMWM